MSITDSFFASQGHVIAAPVPLATLLPLNDLFKDSMQRAQAACGVNKAVTRCDSLPVVRGNREELALVFDTLMASLFASTPTGSKFFVHVDCETCGLPAEDGFARVQIRFHTNITSDAAWMDAHRQAMNDCRHILSLHKATLDVNEVKHTGCLFAITIPGKL